ncbi:hypothetical protein Tdes44962_MAKER09058 [Teratosphaeria destructans]|uniref:Uncharacterized protein n=1 Tax=Teratosphaeria destructans TaxID=418781 RepID=A0A9W7SU65_9PEZI|nr:hypothetical protein Tdes44962_MAKER09058 [Teratosphaeria destructans]
MSATDTQTTPSDQLHPLFRPENFPGARLDREKLKPALLLATRLLSTDPALRFFWTISFAERHSRTPPVTLPERQSDWHYDYPPSKLSAEASQAVSDALKHLAENATFDLSNNLQVIYAALCQDFEDVSLKATAPFPDGTKSAIFFNHLTYEHALVDETPAVHDNRAQLDFALRLIHELAHAAINAARGPVKTARNSLRPDGQTAEEGLELILPCLYGLEIIREPGKLGPPDGAWEVDPDWIAQLFTDAFWSDAARGEQVLRPRLGVALREIGTPKNSIFAVARDADELVELVVQCASHELLGRDDEEKERGERVKLSRE